VIGQRLLRIVAMRGQLVLQLDDGLFECGDLEFDRVDLRVGLALRCDEEIK
jgi:hypothetical protein